MDILNKTYKRRGNTTGETYTAQQLDGDIVIFTNGARIKLTTLLADFEIEGSSSQVNESQTFVTTDEVNPDTFFDTKITDPNILNAVDQVAKNPHAHIPKQLNHESVEAGSTFANRLNDNTAGPGLNLNNNPNDNGYVDHTQQPIANRPPEWDIYDRVKKTETIEISIPFTLTLPKARHIESINDMYETSFTTYLAKEIIKNSNKLQIDIKNAIESWVEDEMNGSSKKKIKGKKQPVKKTKVINVTVKPKTGVQTIQNKVTVVPTGSLESTNFFKHAATTDVDVDKLFAIADENQYQAVLKKYEALKDKAPTHKDVIRFASMIESYELENKPQ